MTTESQQYNCFIRNGRNAIHKHAGPEAKGSNPTPAFTLLWACNPFGRNCNHWQVSWEEAGQIPLKRLLDTWDRNGSTSGPTPWQIYDDDKYYLLVAIATSILVAASCISCNSAAPRFCDCGFEYRREHGMFVVHAVRRTDPSSMGVPKSAYDQVQKQPSTPTVSRYKRSE